MNPPLTLPSPVAVSHALATTREAVIGTRRHPSGRTAVDHRCLSGGLNHHGNHPNTSPFPLTVTLVPTAGVTCEAIRSAAHVAVCRLAGRLTGGEFTDSIRRWGGFALVSAIGGEPMARETPHLVAAIEAISDGQRALNVLFLRDGIVDEEEMSAIRAFRAAQALAMRADWNRRARQSIENRGSVNPRLMVEARELENEFPLEA